jgi:hypothetical protein
MTLKQALWEIVRDENIIITNQNIDWLLDRALKKASGDAQALKESVLERKERLDKLGEPENKSNEELFKQALVEGVNGRIDKTIEQEKQIEEMARILCGEKEQSCAECEMCYHCEFWCECSVLYHAGYRKHTNRFLAKENGEIIPLLPKQSEWISVEDRLPTEGQNVLCYENGNYYIAFYENMDNVISWWDWVDFDRDNTWNEVCPTHWMPLPEAPKMKGGAE